MARLRYNNKLGLLGAALGSNPATDTTITFVSDPGFATITSPDYIPIVLESPSGTTPSGNFEVVWLTAYTATNLTGTISRGMEGTSCVSHLIGVPWQIAPTRIDATKRPDVYYASRSIISEPFPQPTLGTNAQAISSTRVFAMLTPFTEGDVITGISCIVKAAGVGTNPTSIVFGVVGRDNLVKQQSANVAANAGFLSANNPVNINLGSPYTVPTSDSLFLVVWASGTWVTTQMTLLAITGGNTGLSLNSGTPPVATITTVAFPANGASVGTLAGGTNAVAIYLAAY